MTGLPDSRIPIVIGVTGHRQLDPGAIDPIEASTRAVLTRLKAAVPNSQVLLLTALAEGADRLVAQAAADLGIEFVAVLPLPDADYRTDFADAASEAEYDRLLRLARATIEIPVPPAQIAEVREPGRARDEAYARVGDHISRHSLVLLALWDGAEGRGRGGTAHVVMTELTGLHGREDEGETLQDDPVGGTVCHISAPRAGEPPPELPAGGVRWLFREDEVVESVGLGPAVPLDRASVPMVTQLDVLNRQLLDASPETVAAAATAADWFLPEADRKNLSPGLLALLRRYQAADALALRYQRLRFATLKRLGVIGLAGICALEFYQEATGTELWATAILLVYPMSLLLGYAWVRRAQREGHDSRQLDYRALAEGLRIQIAWALGGVDDDVTDHYLHTLRGEFQWVRGAIRAAVLEARSEGGGRALDADPDLEVVQRRWIDDQRGYYRGSVAKKTAQARKYGIVVAVLVWISFLASLGLGPARIYFGDRLLFGVLEELTLVGSMEVFTAFALAIAAAVAAYGQSLLLSEVARQHDRMYLVFRRAATRVETLLEQGQEEAARSVLRELGREALAENAAWVLAHRDRPMEAPAP